jgi:ubiquinone/menaquinone biosynthesis C-methylase UbiE
MIGWIATKGDASAYKYLLKGMENFPTAEDFARELASLGFKDISFQRLWALLPSMLHETVGHC